MEGNTMRRALAIAALALSLLAVPTAAHADAGAGRHAPPVPGAVDVGKSGPLRGFQGSAVQSSQPPVFDNYLVCFNGFVFTDFTDPDGNDVNLNVAMAVFRPSLNRWDSWWMNNTGPSVHGVFFYLELAKIGVDPLTVSQYAFLGVDETGTASTDWTFADSNCQVL
jgi:hypothetical protein